MHELALVSAMVDQVAAISQREHFRRVKKLRLAVGQLSGVDPQCIEFCFNEVTKGSVLEGAELLMESVEILVLCQLCQHRFSPKLQRGEPITLTSCERCGSRAVSVKSGKEFKIIDLEVEDF